MPNVRFPHRVHLSHTLACVLAMVYPRAFGAFDGGPP
jgi:hypothetical protein